MRSKRALLGSLVVLATVLSGMSAQAEEHREGEHERRGHIDFHGRDFRRLTPGELGLWRGGVWRHEWHDGRFGWWWFVGDEWYFYPEPIYPYPAYVPPAVVVQQAPPVPTGLPPTTSWYYCDNPQGYYPYVASCAVAWREVPAAPPAGAPQPPPPR